MNEPLLLPHRAVLSVDGADAEPFLHNLLTCATLSVSQGARSFGALLTPQGKILADLILERTAEGFLIDAPAAIANDLAQKLTRFRLRAKVNVREREDLGVAAFTGAADPRGVAMPLRGFVAIAATSSGTDLAVYHRARIAAGVAEQGVDFSAGDVFPADVNMDLLGGVDFQKGCFVGQEVVSRMKRRGVARRRTLVARLGDEAVAGSAITAGAVEIGTLASRQDELGLVRVRIDRLQDAWTKGAPLDCGGASVEIEQPDWLAGELAALARGATSP
jgi:folate-binding protein YgfZ